MLHFSDIPRIVEKFIKDMKMVRIRGAFFRKNAIWIWFHIDHFPEIIGKCEKF